MQCGGSKPSNRDPRVSRPGAQGFPRTYGSLGAEEFPLLSLPIFILRAVPTRATRLSSLGVCERSAEREAERLASY